MKQVKSSDNPIVIKSTTSNSARIAGYASVFNIKDSHGDIIIPGAFKNTDLTGNKIKLLWQHDHKQPIGIISLLKEDTHGLYIEAEINCATTQGKEIIALLKQGAVDGLSIGFCIKDADVNHDRTRVIKSVELWEVSLVTFPANKDAKILHIQKNNDNTQQSKEQTMHNIFSVQDELPITKEHFFTTRPEIATTMEGEKTAEFVNFLRKGDMNGLIEKSYDSTDDNGGVLIHPTLYNKIIGAIKLRCPLRNLASVETISSGVYDVIAQAGGFAAKWVADGASRDETEAPKLIKKKIYVHELYAQPKASQRLIEDSAINLENWLVENLRDSFGFAEDEAFINGDGNQKPFGILHYAGGENDVEMSSADGIMIDDLINMLNSMAEQFLANATFLMHRRTLAKLQSLKDANGRFIWQAAISDKGPDTILGVPVVCSDAMPIDEHPVVLADFASAYKIVERSGISLLRDPYTDKPFVKFYAVKRLGGDVVNPNAMRILSKASA